MRLRFNNWVVACGWFLMVSFCLLVWYAITRWVL